ncbi:hypothetical protein HYPSUDRAFT_207241 [Hypholoma sublateritium FD-334 SS-4]|uniref:DUF7918 domain-containing protein n=1 Tax=Hypholoma sublateritium (strain FD-334 SS-4) TaxID=945553 RepID=A0A0D2KNJ9_HYPSF|nr:hypothetical protein HYPSUDRAFT_207241 [Hypholoma sublateritium FD-334 SS-4]
MLQLDNFLAWVTVDGRELTEYGVEYSQNLLCATCWIASEQQKNFVVNWRDTVRPDHSIGRMTVDGVRCGVSKGINRKGYRADPSTERDSAQQRGVPTSINKDRLLVFSKLDLTDDDRYLDSAVSDELGDIKLEITYVKKGEKKRLKVAPFATESKVHERTQKLAQHHTSLGQTVEGERKVTHSIKPVGNTKVFLFKYRPLDILKARGLVPREIPEPLGYEVVDLTESDDIKETTIPRLQKEEEMTSVTPLHGIKELPSKREPSTGFKQEAPLKVEDTFDSKCGLGRIKQDPSRVYKREIKEDPDFGVGWPRGSAASSSATIKSEGMKHEEGQVGFKTEEALASRRIKAEQIGNIRETKVEERANIIHSRQARREADVEVIDLT